MSKSLRRERVGGVPAAAPNPTHLKVPLSARGRSSPLTERVMHTENQGADKIINLLEQLCLIYCMLCLSAASETSYLLIGCPSR